MIKVCFKNLSELSCQPLLQAAKGDPLVIIKLLLAAAGTNSLAVAHLIEFHKHGSASVSSPMWATAFV
jgi:hypothetical protein